MFRVRTCLAALTCLASVTAVEAGKVYEKHPDSVWYIEGWYIPDGDYVSCDLITELDTGGKVKIIVQPYSRFPYMQQVDLYIDAHELYGTFKPYAEMNVDIAFVSDKYGVKELTTKGRVDEDGKIVWFDLIGDDISERLISHDRIVFFANKSYRQPIDLDGTKLLVTDYLSDCKDVVLPMKKKWP